MALPKKRDNLLFEGDFKDVVKELSDEELAGKTAREVRAELDRIMGKKEVSP